MINVYDRSELLLQLGFIPPDISHIKMYNIDI